MLAEELRGPVACMHVHLTPGAPLPSPSQSTQEHIRLAYRRLARVRRGGGTCWLCDPI